MRKLGPLQQKFVTELRSGKWKQTKAMLRDDKGYCCLGIATEVVCGIRPDSQSHASGRYVYHGNGATLPEEVKEQMKFHNHRGAPLGSGMSLVGLNDEGISFKEIAGILEADPEQYFSEEA